MPRKGYKQIRANDEEGARWDAQAKAEGTDFSEWARRRLNEPSRLARLQAQVDRMADDLATFQEFFRARRAGEPPIPQPEMTPADWEGQSDYKRKETHAKVE